MPEAGLLLGRAADVPEGGARGAGSVRRQLPVQEALRACGREAGRACLLPTLGTRTLELQGLKLPFGTAQRQPRPFVEIRLLNSDGRFRR